MNIKSKDIALNALIASLYVVLTLICYPVSFMGLQFRISEILLILIFFNRKYSIGLILGCLIANMFSPIWPYDLLFGTFATIIAVVGFMFIKRLGIVIIIPVVSNALLIGFELWWKMEADFIYSCLYVALGEALVMIAGYVLFMVFARKKTFQRIINANRNIDFKW